MELIIEQCKNADQTKHENNILLEDASYYKIMQIIDVYLLKCGVPLQFYVILGNLDNIIPIRYFCYPDF